MINPNPNILLRIAQADAYCVATEYIKLPRDQETYDQALRLEKYLRHPHRSGAAGLYSDDTHQSIAISEVLLNPPFSKLKFAQAFVNVFHRDPRKGYAKGYQDFIEKTISGQDFLNNIIPTSEKNGAAMRSAVIGVLRTPWEVIAIAKMQAEITHDTKIGILSSQAVALMSHLTLYTNHTFDEIFSDCCRYLPEFEQFLIPLSGSVKSPDVTLKTMQAVVQLLKDRNSLLDILKGCIVPSSDTDTVAAIAWGIASSRYQNEVLPDWMETQLESGRKHGVEFLKDLGQQLMDKYK